MFNWTLELIGSKYYPDPNYCKSSAPTAAAGMVWNRWCYDEFLGLADFCWGMKILNTDNANTKLDVMLNTD